jgi:hypothetical protein
MAASTWDEIVKAKKGVRTSDQQACGNIISEDGDSIVISEGAVNTHRYVVPKNKVDNYNGTEIQLKIPYNILSTFEVKEDNLHISSSSSISDTIREKIMMAGKEKNVETETTEEERSISDDKRKREYEEGGAGTQVGPKDDPLTEYRDKEAMTPAKIKEHEPTAVKRDPSDQKIVEPGQEGGGTNTDEAREKARRSGMTKGTAGAAETGSKYEQGDAGTSSSTTTTMSNKDQGSSSETRAFSTDDTTTTQTFTCESCGRTFNSREELREHNIQGHDDHV